MNRKKEILYLREEVSEAKEKYWNLLWRVLSIEQFLNLKYTEAYTERAKHVSTLPEQPKTKVR